MSRTSKLVALAVSAVLASCASAPNAPQVARGETLFFNGRIYTDARDASAVEALLVRDGRVVVAGSLADAERASNDAGRQYVDLRGACAVPGLQDAHGHIEGLGQALENVDLRGAATYAELIDRVARAAAKVEPGTWISGRGWDQTLWPGGEFPRHSELSAAVPHHPVILSRVDGHAVLVNARALELAGVGRGLAENVVDGGRVMLDENGAPTGVFIDAASALVTRVVPATDDATRVRRILHAQEHLLELGVTAVHDMGIGPATLRAFERVRDEGELKLRVRAYLSDPGEANDFVRSARRRASSSADKLRVVGVKLYADGALGSRGAALLEPYSDDLHNSGLMQLSQEELAARVSAYAALGLQPAVHAIGDRANRVVLDVYEAQMRGDERFKLLRPRIEHAQVVAEADWTRFAVLGVIPSMQPTHATSDMRWADERVGAARIAGAYAWRRLPAEPVKLAFGSDFPVEDANPCLGLYAALTRQNAEGMPPMGFTPDQRLDAHAALEAFTAGAAYAVHEENERGRLLPGFRADITVLDVDPLRCTPRELLAARATMTVIDGEIVMRR